MHKIIAKAIPVNPLSCSASQPICPDAIGDFSFYAKVTTEHGWDDIWFSSLYSKQVPYTITRVGQFVVWETANRTLWPQRPALYYKYQTL